MKSVSWKQKKSLREIDFVEIIVECIVTEVSLFGAAIAH